MLPRNPGSVISGKSDELLDGALPIWRQIRSYSLLDLLLRRVRGPLDSIFRR